jgi:hypothetical protein
MVTILAMSAYLLVDFGKFSAASNEKNIRRQANYYIQEITKRYRDKLDLTFSRPLSFVELLAKQAGELYSFPDTYGATSTDPINILERLDINGVFSNGPNIDVNSIYWGGTTVTDEIIREHNAISKIDQLLAATEKSDPSFTAAWMITKSGYGKYTPNIHSAAMLPPPSEFDLRKKSDDPPYSLMSPEFNPQKKIMFGELYMDAAGNGLTVSALAPVYTRSGEFKAAVGIDISLKDMR